MLSDRYLISLAKKENQNMYEISVMNQEKVGFNSIELVEHLYTCRTSVAAERLMFKLRAQGFAPRLKFFDCEPVFSGDEDKIVEELKKLEV